MTYKETHDYLFAQLPMFHRIGAAAYKADLNNTHAIMDMLDHPEKDFNYKNVDCVIYKEPQLFSQMRLFRLKIKMLYNYKAALTEIIKFRPGATIPEL